MSKENTIRNKKLLWLKKQNMAMANQIHLYLSNARDLSAIERELAEKLQKSLTKCAASAVYGYDEKDGITLLSFLSCSHKICNVCNWDRQKKIRRKYIKFFQQNKQLLYVSNDKSSKYVTSHRFDFLKEHGWRELDRVDYDLQHLMLSVPHTENGWRGQRFYFRSICSAFNTMRKKEEWLQYVYGGQFGLETTKNSNGYHIHIHALLFVAKCPQNRNKLHLIILKLWNRLTIDESSIRNRKNFTEQEIAGIKQGNKLITDDYINSLDPRGATIIHLETIYYYTKDRRKVYVSDFDSGGFIPAVLETISYLFKPKVFCCDDDLFDVESVVELLPEVYNNKSLYSKFGCLFGESQLNIKDNSLLEDLEAISDREVVDEETGEVLMRHYFVTNPFNTYSPNDESIELKRNSSVNNLNASTAVEAVTMLHNIYNVRR